MQDEGGGPGAATSTRTHSDAAQCFKAQHQIPEKETRDMAHWLRTYTTLTENPKFVGAHYHL